MTMAMQKNILRFILLACFLTGWSIVYASPTSELRQFRAYFETRFPNLKLSEFSKGEWIPGIAGSNALAQYHSIMDFPPQSFAVDRGQKLFHKAFPDGSHYGNCFPHHGVGIAQTYPRFNEKTGQVETLALKINQCRVKNHLKPLAYEKGALADILAYMASTSKGKKISIKTPKTSQALQAYSLGKNFFYARIGALNLSCADCHMIHSGQRLRGQMITPALGLLAGFPVYRAKWGDMGTVDRRFRSCNKKIRAKPFKPQSIQYRDLQYFLTYMSNGLPSEGPGYRN